VGKVPGKFGFVLVFRTNSKPKTFDEKKPFLKVESKGVEGRKIKNKKRKDTKVLSAHRESANINQEVTIFLAPTKKNWEGGEKKKTKKGLGEVSLWRGGGEK